MERSAEIKLQTVEQLVQAKPEIAGLQAYEYFRNNNASQKAAFLSDDSFELNLDYPDLNYDAITKLEQPTRLALGALMSGETNIKTETLFRSIEYRYTELYMMSTAVAMNDKALPQSERISASLRFKEANEALYGKPEIGIFNALYKKSFGSILESSNNENHNIVAELQSRLGALNDAEVEPFRADPEVVERINGLVTERFAGLIDHIDPDRTYDVAGMASVLQTALRKIGGDELGWEVIVAPNSSALAVSAHQRKVEVGVDRKDIDGKTLQGKVLHEVGIHTLRSMNAERAGYLAAMYGQDGYLDFEEALATALEDAFAGKFVDHGVDYYLIAGLAYGLDNHEPRDFREVFEIMWRQRVLKAGKGAAVTEEQITKAQSAAFTSCMRLFRGTDTKTPGIVYLKDLAYFRGQELAWSTLGNVTTQDEFDIFFTGKLDLTQSDHLEVAKRILEHK